MVNDKLELPVKDIYSDRIPIAKCRQILNAYGNSYTDEQVLLIRDFLYSLAVVDYYVNEKMFQEELLKEQKTKDHDGSKEGNFIFPSEYRRAS